MTFLPNLTAKLLFIFVFILLQNFICFAQDKADLEVKVQPASKTARGGETFSYIVTISNIGSATAEEVVLHQTTRQSEVSAVSTAGTCADMKLSYQIPRPFVCKLGNIEKGATVTINFVMKIREFGGEEISLAVNLPRLSRSEGKKKSELTEITLAEIEVFGDDKRNYSKVVVEELLPSKNLPPRLKIISPKPDVVIIKQVNKPLNALITVNAFDPDGKIEKVVFANQENIFQKLYKTQQVFDEVTRERKFIFEGKTYKEAEINKVLFDFKTATLTGKDTYTFKVENLQFGQNRISISAIDDGERADFAHLEIIVKGDAEIKIVSPENKQVFSPGSTITIETLSKINDPNLGQLKIEGTQIGFYPDFASFPLMQQVSKTGNLFKHRFVWKNPEEGIYRLRIISFSDAEITNEAETISVIIAEPRIVKITSLQNGQEFEYGNSINITSEVKDIKGREVNDKQQILVDGKYKDETYGEYELRVLEKGTHTIQIIARQNNSSDDVILGKSEIITIKVK